jgi:hypothetical protein
MRTIPCPAGDGNCVVPDPAVVVLGGQLSLVRTSGLERLFPDPLEARQPAHFEGDLRYDVVVGHLTETLRWEALNDVSEVIGLDPYSYSPPEESLDFIRSLEDSLGTREGVIITCSCGHTWTT